jgi:hypothetical protein
MGDNKWETSNMRHKTGERQCEATNKRVLMGGSHMMAIIWEADNWRRGIVKFITGDI